MAWSLYRDQKLVVLRHLPNVAACTSGSDRPACHIKGLGLYLKSHHKEQDPLLSTVHLIGFYIRHVIEDSAIMFSSG